jgi:hypothetical protein
MSRTCRLFGISRQSIYQQEARCLKREKELLTVRQLVKKSSEDQKNHEESKHLRVKKILDRKEKSKTTENTMLNSAPLSMQNTMQFIDERNEAAKSSPNYKKQSANRIGVNELSDHDMFKNFFQR